MDESQKILVSTVLATVLLIGLIGATLSGAGGQSASDEKYKDILGNLDGSARALRFRNSPSNALSTAQSQYKNLVKAEDLENNSDILSLDNKIKNSFSYLVSRGENANADRVYDLRNKVSELAGSLGMGLPFAFKYAAPIVFGISILLAFLLTILCMGLTDWEGLEEAKRILEERRKEMGEASRRKGKGKQRFEQKKKELRNKRRKIWAVNIKQAVFYLAPFSLFLAWLGQLYGDWTIVWLPFDWLSSGAFRSIGVSLGVFGWLLLSYFGFAQLWREFLLPKR